MTPNSKVCKGLPGSRHLETCGSGFGFGLQDRPRGYVSDLHRPPPRFILSRPGVGARGAPLEAGDGRKQRRSGEPHTVSPPPTEKQRLPCRRTWKGRKEKKHLGNAR
ncbi:unnamed protein product [Rangifer tarandus platyrhynchus]|uniref:Uncharacterized protein n=2 Tax=Rangifer tarandus platyrhynchus TaxID=3082113 RepID=A0ACB0DTT4_RANTA|nr:unnamed protein product [Rangifer tarandus platyrhynchus]CAI9691697.1 unnamed protein product [Rangifer tarandus platyrhynchus]